MIFQNPSSPQHSGEAALHKLLAHPARLAILDALRAGEECVCHLEALLGYRQAYLSQQLAVLREAGIVVDRRDGWNHFYKVVSPEIYAVIDAVRGLLRVSPPVPSDRQSSPDCPCPKCANKPVQDLDIVLTEIHSKEK